MENPPQTPEQIDLLKRQLEHAKKDLERLERIKSLATITSSVVHDIRNSLGVISSTSQFVLSSLKPSDKEKHAWELVVRNVESIKAILKNYLSFARQVEGDKEPQSINDIIRRVCHYIDSQSHKQNTRVEMELDASNPIIVVESSAIESSILNMAINALEAIQHDGRLKFTTRREGGVGLALEIEDSGPGMSPETMANIFLPFFTTKKTGTGMGLYSAKIAVENNGGQIACRSALGTGTTMRLTFPIPIKVQAPASAQP